MQNTDLISRLNVESPDTVVIVRIPNVHTGG
jgi:hypothetical protein